MIPNKIRTESQTQKIYLATIRIPILKRAIRLQIHKKKKQTSIVRSFMVVKILYHEILIEKFTCSFIINKTGECNSWTFI